MYSKPEKIGEGLMVFFVFAHDNMTFLSSSATAQFEWSWTCSEFVWNGNSLCCFMIAALLGFGLVEVCGVLHVSEKVAERHLVAWTCHHHLWFRLLKCCWRYHTLPGWWLMTLNQQILCLHTSYAHTTAVRTSAISCPVRAVVNSWMHHKSLIMSHVMPVIELAILSKGRHSCMAWYYGSWSTVTHRNNARQKLIHTCQVMDILIQPATLWRTR